MHGLVATYTCDEKIAVGTTGTGSTAACRAAAILCSHAEWCRKFVQRAAVSISLAAQNWLKNLPRQIDLYEVW